MDGQRLQKKIMRALVYKRRKRISWLDDTLEDVRSMDVRDYAAMPEYRIHWRGMVLETSANVACSAEKEEENLFA